MRIPIVDQDAVIVAWTSTAPEVRGDKLFHREAEALIGPHYASYVEIHDRQDAIRAGAPAHWRSAWRCLGLCSAKLMRRQSASQVPLIRVFPGTPKGFGGGVVEPLRSPPSADARAPI